MNIQITDHQAEILRAFVLDELQSIKAEEADGFKLDMNEVDELIDLTAVLGEPVSWQDLESASDDDSPAQPD